MLEKATPPEEAAYPPTIGGEADSLGEFSPQDPSHPGSGWISPFRIGLAVVVLVAALVSWQLTRTSSPTYRTSAVGTGTVVATLTSVGTITPVNQANLNFNVSGTVGAVDVSVGQTVTAGQTLASLDVADLNAAVITAQATLASATATLSDAEASETATTTSDVTTSTTPTAPSASATTTSTTLPTSNATQSSQNDQRINQLQATLVADQRQEDEDSAQAAAALKQATAVCDAAVSATTTPPPTGTSSTPAAPPGGAPPAGQTCSDALAQASAAQSTLTADIKTVDHDESELNAALGSSSGAGGGGAPTGGSGTGGSGTGGSGTGGGGTHPTGGTTGGTSSGSSSSATAAATAGAGSGASAASGTGSTSRSQSSGTQTKPATPTQLAVDQASIDTAQANLTDSQQALGGANLASTIAGTVASVSIAPGDSVTAGSTSAADQIVVIGSGTSYQVITDVPVASIAEVAVGQQVQITPNSTNTVLSGQVESIGVLASSGSTSTTYPVTISLQSPDLGQLSGADADVAIIVKRSVDVTTVASSAVRTVGSIHLVTVVENNTAKPVRVTLGTVGATLTQVTSGVSVGQLVSLADLNEPLPSTSSTTTRFGGALGAGGLTGGGLGGGAGGFGGGGGVARFAG